MNSEWIGVILVGILFLVYLISTNGGVPRRTANYQDYIDVVDNDPKMDEKVLMAAAGLVEARKNGRHLGGPVRVNWDVSKHSSVDCYIAWAEREGPKHGVFIHRVGE